MNTGLFSLREQEIFNTLKQLKDCKFVMIGGYAVNAYALPRFSADCDIVVKDKKELHKIEKALLNMNYKRITYAKEVLYSRNFARYEKRLENNFSVSMDILFGNVIDRMTRVTFQAGWVFRNSGSKRLKGKTITEDLQLNIINIDALIVMKLISCRATDIRDIFMVLPNAENTEWIKSEISLRYNLNDRIEKIIEKVTSRQFKDGISGVYGYFDSKLFDKHKKAIMSLRGV